MLHLTPFPRRLLCLTLTLFLLLPLPARAEEIIGGEDSGLVNLLLIGRDNEADSCSRADCIILCTLRPQTRLITVTSFLRDLYVPIPGHEDNRLNAAYALGGMALLRQTLEESFGLHIDGCIDVDFNQFSRIIDLLGGVEVELRQDEADFINGKTDSHLTEGPSLLTGQQALIYSRIRKLDSDGDFSRTARQRKVLFSLLERYRSASLLTVLSVIADALPMIDTDLQKRQILSLGSTLFPVLRDPVIVSQRVPEDDSFSYRRIRNMEVLWADIPALRQQLRESLLPSGSTPAG